jgi:hypothetical protein
MGICHSRQLQFAWNWSIFEKLSTPTHPVLYKHSFILLKLVVCILLRVLGQVQGFRLTQHWFEYFIQ